MNRSVQGEVNNHKANAQILCAHRGMTFSDLGRLIGWTPNAVHVILSRRNPTPKNLRIVAKALGVTTERLSQPVNLTEYGHAMVPRYKEE